MADRECGQKVRHRDGRGRLAPLTSHQADLITRFKPVTILTIPQQH
jgi:hypothetical protein